MVPTEDMHTDDRLKMKLSKINNNFLIKYSSQIFNPFDSKLNVIYINVIYINVINVIY